MNREQKIWLGIIVLLFVVFAVYCLHVSDSNETMSETVEAAEFEEDLITDSDYNDTTIGARKIIIDSAAERDWGSYASYKDGELVIYESGSYCLSGRLEGTLVVSASDDEQVHLILNGLEVYSSGAPALRVESASKVIVTAAEESQNLFCDTEYRTDKEENSCIYSVADLTFNGTGMVNVWGYYQDAIASKGRIKVIQGNYSIRAVDDGIRGRDGVVIAGGIFDLQTEGTGIKSTNTENENKGDIYIQGGEITIIAGEHAINAAKNLGVIDCKISTRTTFDSFVCQGELLLTEGCIDEIDE